jgi:Kef-type K+ transport system membrane component KefB
MILVILVLLAVWLQSVHARSGWQQAGFTSFSLGFLLLLAYVSANLLNTARIPLISGYIFAGMVIGPHITGLLSHVMVTKLRLVDDLALSFIALTAGATLHLKFLRKRIVAIVLNISLLTILVFVLVSGFLIVAGPFFAFARSLSRPQIIALGLLIGVIAVARSPSSAIAIIRECRASGIFTETVLGVTVAMDVLIIIFFTVALAVSRMITAPDPVLNWHVFSALLGETTVSLMLGAVLGKGIAVYIRKVNRDLPLFLLFIAFGISKASFWLDHFMEAQYAVSLHLEPLLVCMSAGFAVQNLSSQGARMLESLERISLPIYVLFFALAGASLDLTALRMTWPVATGIATARTIGIFLATWLAGTIQGDPPGHNRIAWMAYLTQAGVAIGLAQLAERQFPDIGVYVTTLVLAVITINQVVGPVTFKVALEMVGEAESV